MFISGMANPQNRDYKAILAKCLLTATLLLGLSAFSGYGGNAQWQQNEFTRTELVVSDNTHTAQGFSYKRAFTKACKNHVFASFCKPETGKASLHYDKLIKVAFDCISKQFVHFKQSDGFYKVKTIPQSSDKDFPNLF